MGDETGDALADAGGALGLGIGAHGFHFAEEPFRAGDDIGFVIEGGDKG